MFKEIFATMNEALDDIRKNYSNAGVAKTETLDEQFNILKTMSDHCLEEWLHFEERMSECRSELMTTQETFVLPPATPDDVVPSSENFVKGQGYYKLYMFQQAMDEFSKLVKEYPDFVLGRVYLAMSYLRLGMLEESYRHFQLLMPLTSNAKLKAISYHAMGCIQVQNQNMEQAIGYFKMAGLADSSFMEPSFWNKEFWPYQRT